MRAVLFLLSCIINSIGCSIFDENQASEYDDFHDGSYSYADDDADYEDEYNEPTSTEPQRVRRYDRVTHTVPAPVLTIGLPEVKDALQMLMLGRNLSSTDIKDLEGGRSQFVYPNEMNFIAKVSTENAVSPTPSLEIPIEFYEIKLTTEPLGTREKSRSREQPMEPPRTYFKDQPIRVAFTHEREQYTIDRSTNNATIKIPTRSDFIVIEHEMIPFENKSIARNRLNIFKNTPQEEDDTVGEPIINRVKEPIIPPQHALRELMLGRNLTTGYDNPTVNVCHTTVKIDAEYIDGPTIIQIEPTISTYIDALRMLMLGRNLRTRYKNQAVDVSHTTVEIDAEYIEEPIILQNESTFSTYIGKRLNRQDYVNVRATKPDYMEVPDKMKPVMKTKDKNITAESTLFKLKHKQNDVEYYIVEEHIENKNIKNVPTRIDFDEQIDKNKNANRKLNKNTSANPTRNEVVEKKTEIEYIIGRSTKPLNTKATSHDFFKRGYEEVYFFEKPTENIAQETTTHNYIENKIEMKYMIHDSTETITIMEPTRVEYTGQTNAITRNTKLEKPTRNQILSDMPKGFQSTSLKQPTKSEPKQNVNTDEKAVIETIVEKPLDLAHNTSIITSDDLFDKSIMDFVPYKPLRTEFISETPSDSLLENTSVTNKNKLNKYSEQLTEEEYKIEGPISINPSLVGLISKPLRVESQKTSTSNKLLTIIPKTYSNRTEVSVTDKRPKLQKIYYYDDKKSGTDVYIETESTKENLLRGPPVALPTRSNGETFQTVFLYDNEVPEDGIIIRMDNDKEDDDDGVMLAGNWSEEYDPLEFLLTDESLALRQGGNQTTTTQNGGNQNTDTTSSTTTTTTTSTTKKKKSKKPKVKTTTAYPFDVEKFLELVANLTYEYYNEDLLQRINASLVKAGAPTCPTPSTVTTTTTRYTGFIRPDYSIMENKIMGKCYVCGLVDEGVPWNAHCADAFAGDFLPLSPVDASAKGQLAKYRKYCRYDDVDHYVHNASTPRTIYGRWTGGCGVRWTDISSIYTQRTCRNRNHPTTGKHYASKRMSKLEMALANVENGCIVSPVASLIPLSRGISLYARFHACVCTGSWCNVSWRLDSDSGVWKAYVIVGLLLVLR